MLVLSETILVLSALVGSAADAEVPNYSIQFDSQTLQSNVSLCLNQAHAYVKFSADSPMAMSFVSNVTRSVEKDVQAESDGWSAASWHAGECLSYVVDLGKITSGSDRDVGRRIGSNFIFGPEYWLLRSDAQGDAGAEVDIALPAGWSLSAPWRASTADNAKLGTLRFHIPNTPRNWSAEVALGKFQEQRIVQPGGELRVTILRNEDEALRQKVSQWLTRSSQALLQAYGRMPIPQVQVRVLPIDLAGYSKEIVSTFDGHAVWGGESTRGEGNSLELAIDARHPLSEFVEDWTAVHELSHLTHPYLGDEGSWLAEGLATYYQNVLRSRAGLLTPAQAWERMANGFRDNNSKADDVPLEEAARTMHRTHRYQRVYWTGTAYWLTVDVELRRATNGRMSIDTALSHFRDCCLPSYREWQPDEFVRKLDGFAGSDVLLRRYREFAAMRQFPDWKKVYSDLGIRTDSDKLRFDDSAPAASVRQAIMAPHPAN